MHTGRLYFFHPGNINSSKSATVSCYTAWALCSLLYGIIPFSGRSLVGVLQDPRCSLSFPHFIFPTPAIRIKVNSVQWHSHYLCTSRSATVAEQYKALKHFLSYQRQKQIEGGSNRVSRCSLTFPHFLVQDDNNFYASIFLSD